MASPVIYNALSSQNPTKKKTYNGLADSMLGTNPQFNQGIPSTPKLPQNYGFNDLAGYEEQRRSALGGQFQDQINQARTGIESQYGTALKGYQDTSAQRRAALASSLTDQAQKNFQLQNPGILEDLNSRGVFSSPTAVAQAQAQAMKELELANQSKLTDFDAQQRAYEDELNKNRLNELNQLSLAGTSANIQSQQDALDAGLNLRTASLNNQFQQGQANQEQAFAEDLAKQQQKNQLTNSLIGVGGQLGTTYLGSKLFGGGGAASALGGSLGGVGTSGTVAGSSLFPGGLGAVGTGAKSFGFTPGLGSLAAGGIGAMLLARGAEKKIGSQFGKTAGNIAGTIANPIGQQLNKAKNIISNPKKAIKKVFCFEAGTPITMDDGSQRPIDRLYVGALTKGGEVISIRTSKTDDGTRYLYKGIQVTGSHAVKENGKWLRVKDSDFAAPQAGEGIVWSLVTSDHRIWIDGIEMADEHEHDDYEHISIEESLIKLNSDEKEKEGVLV